MVTAPSASRVRPGMEGEGMSEGTEGGKEEGREKGKAHVSL